MNVVDRIRQHFALSESSAAAHDRARDEAVIDLLYVAMLADRTSTEAEREVIRGFVDTRPWELGHSAESYLDEAAARIRGARSSGPDFEAFVAGIVARLPEAEDRRFARAMVREVAMADGAASPAEQAILERLGVDD